jgi:hypothetical protein
MVSPERGESTGNVSAEKQHARTRSAERRQTGPEDSHQAAVAAGPKDARATHAGIEWTRRTGG